MSDEVDRVAWVSAALDSGRAIRIIQDAGLTYLDVAEFCEVSKPTAWCWLNGRVNRPRRAHALRLAALLTHIEEMSR